MRIANADKSSGEQRSFLPAAAEVHPRRQQDQADERVKGELSEIGQHIRRCHGGQARATGRAGAGGVLVGDARQ